MQSAKPTQAPGAVKHDELSERLLLFAVRIGKLVNALPANRLGRHVALKGRVLSPDEQETQPPNEGGVK